MEHIDNEFFLSLNINTQDAIKKAYEILLQGDTDRDMSLFMSKISDKAVKFLGCGGGSETVNFLDDIANNIY